jgi:hypothetical protein
MVSPTISLYLLDHPVEQLPSHAPVPELRPYEKPLGLASLRVKLAQRHATRGLPIDHRQRQPPARRRVVARQAGHFRSEVLKARRETKRRPIFFEQLAHLRHPRRALYADNLHLTPRPR